MQNHYNQALAYLRDYCLRHGRLMHFSHGAIFEAEGAAARLFGYIESGSFQYLRQFGIIKLSKKLVI